MTSSLDAYTTDSGAGGTALLTGHKVQNYHIAQSPEGKPYPSILVQAQQKGKRVGFVVTSSVTDATPAATYAHVANRKSKDSISLQMSQCGFDVMIGGEYNCFLPKYRKDGLNPFDTLKARGYHVSRTVKDMRNHKEGKLCALLTDESPDLAPLRDTFLAAGTRKAIELLREDSNGFVLMIEGSHIDKSCHANNDTALMVELSEFEAMLGVVLDFAKQDGNTLVVVTADHETGGLALPTGNLEKGESTCKFITNNHTGVMVPVFAYGPQSKAFAGIHENVDIYTLVKAALDRTGRMTPLLRGHGKPIRGRGKSAPDRGKSAPARLGGEGGQPMLAPAEKPSRILTLPQK